MTVTFSDLVAAASDFKTEVDRLEQLRRDAYALALFCNAAIQASRSMHDYENTTIDIPELEAHTDAVLNYFVNPIAVVDNGCRRHRG